MPIDEEAMRFLEEHIPDLADSAVKQAYWATLASGNNVLICEKGVIIEVHPDGTRKSIKQVSPTVPILKGQRFKIQ